MTPFIEVPVNIILNLQKGVATQVNIPVKSLHTAPIRLKVAPSCGCTTGVDKMIVEPLETKIASFTITKTVSSQVTISFINEDTQSVNKTVLTVNIIE